jgi:hypothetical protein
VRSRQGGWLATGSTNRPSSGGSTNARAGAGAAAVALPLLLLLRLSLLMLLPPLPLLPTMASKAVCLAKSALCLVRSAGATGLEVTEERRRSSSYKANAVPNDCKKTRNEPGVGREGVGGST